MPLAPLPTTTVKLIGSSQVITSVSSVIKELMENSLDSGAQHIEIKLDKHGLEKIEVKDDGCGIGKSDATVMCLPSYTSKILDFSDLDSLSSYGFRGEALSSLCNVAQVSITTKTGEDDVATCYTYDHNGQVTCSKISHISKGTIVTVTDLFKNLPVRKQFVSSSKRAAEELKRVEKVVKSLGMIHPRLRVTLIHNKFLIWQKTSVANLRQSVMQVVNINIVKQLHHILHSSDQIRVEMLVPKRECDVSSICFSNFTDAYFLFINNRPVRSKEVEKAVYNKLFEFFGVYMPANKYPVCVTNLRVPSDCLDVNLEPNKTRIYFKNHDEVIDFVNQCMHIYYGEGKREEEENLLLSKSSKKRRIEEEYPVEQKKVNLDPDEQKLIAVTNCEPVDIINQEISLSSSDTANCSVESSLKHELDSRENVDRIFEKFCIEREKESRVSTENNNIFNALSNLEPYRNSNSSSSNIYSEFFPGVTDKAVQNKSVIITDNMNFNSCVNKQQNLNTQFDKENKNSSLKKMVSCLERISENSLTQKKIHTMEANLSRDNNPSATGDEILINPDEEGNSKSLNGVCELELYKEEGKLSTNNGQELFSMDLGFPTLSQWSKGVIVNSARGQVKGPCLLAGVTPESPSSSQALTNCSVSSQMGCKEMSAFTKFARNMRREILEEHPNLSFVKVAQMLQVQWRHLDVGEKKKYEETVKLKKSPCSSLSSKQKPISAFVNSSPNIELEISMDKIIRMVKEDRGEDDGDVRLVGQLEASSLWLYHQRDVGLFALSVPRLLEAVRYHQHLAEFAVPSKLLSESVTIKSSDLSAKEWELLLSLERSPNGVIKDEHFTNNGLLIEISEDNADAHLSYVPQNIAYCGVGEVREVLAMLLNHGFGTALAQCRPLKIISFIRSEVMRKCSQEDPPSQPETVSELLSYWLNCVSRQSQDCIHHRLITQRLYSS